MEAGVGRELLRLTGGGLLLVAGVALVAPRPVRTPLHHPVVVVGVALILAVVLRSSGGRSRS